MKGAFLVLYVYSLEVMGEPSFPDKTMMFFRPNFYKEAIERALVIEEDKGDDSRSYAIGVLDMYSMSDLFYRAC